MTIGQLIAGKDKRKPYSSRTAPKAITGSMDFAINYRAANGRKVSDRVRIITVANQSELVVFSLPPNKQKENKK